MGRSVAPRLCSKMFTCSLGKGSCRVYPDFKTTVILGEHLGRHIKALNLGRWNPSVIHSCLGPITMAFGQPAGLNTFPICQKSAKTSFPKGSLLSSPFCLSRLDTAHSVCSRSSFYCISLALNTVRNSTLM